MTCRSQSCATRLGPLCLTTIHLRRRDGTRPRLNLAPTERDSHTSGVIAFLIVICPQREQRAPGVPERSTLHVPMHSVWRPPHDTARFRTHALVGDATLHSFTVGWIPPLQTLHQLALT